MGKCTKCGKESGVYYHCTSCKGEWKQRRLKAYAQVVEEMGEITPHNGKEFRKRLAEIEKA